MPRRVVVREDDGARTELERALDDLARIDAGLRERAAEHRLEREQAVLRVEEQHGEHLVPRWPELQAQVVLDALRRIEHRPRASCCASARRASSTTAAISARLAGPSP
jgi:hypothetical protein